MPNIWTSHLSLYGNAELLQQWLEKQLKKCDDSSFGESFATFCPLPGIEAAAYQHRILKIDSDLLLVGIRFKGGDISHPFVDLLAWTGTPKAKWKTQIAAEYKNFHPRSMRLAWSPEKDPPGQVKSINMCMQDLRVEIHVNQFLKRMNCSGTTLFEQSTICGVHQSR